MKKYNNYDLHFRFETKEGIHFQNIQYIHPLKQQLVHSYVTCFEQEPNIKAAIIFGSSVESVLNAMIRSGASGIILRNIWKKQILCIWMQSEHD